jgi:hypothetical protein
MEKVLPDSDGLLCIQKIPSLDPIMNPWNSVHNLTRYSFKIPYAIIFILSLRNSSKWFFHLRFTRSIPSTYPPLSSYFISSSDINWAQIFKILCMLFVWKFHLSLVQVSSSVFYFLSPSISALLLGRGNRYHAYKKLRSFICCLSLIILDLKYVIVENLDLMCKVIVHYVTNG